MIKSRRPGTPGRASLVFCAFLAAATLVGACSEPSRPPPQPVPVTVAQVEQRIVPFEITAPGTVEPIRAVAVAAQVSGLVTAVRFNEGDEVTERQILFEIDARPYRNALQQARASVARDAAQYANAKRQVERYEALAKNEYVSDEQFQTLRANAEALSAALKSDSAALDNARINLENTTIRAPISGRTGSLLIKEGNLVRAPGSGPMVLLNQTKPIMVRFSVPATFLPEIRKRSQADTLLVRARPANDDRLPLQGVLTFVDNAVDTTTGTIMLKASFTNDEAILWPGQFVTTTLVLYSEEAIVAPASAVMNGDHGPYVFVIGEDQKAESRPITVSRTLDDVVIVTRGLALNETVVSDGQLRLVPGAKVDIGVDEAVNGSAVQENGPGRGGRRSGRRGGRGGDSTQRDSTPGPQENLK